MFSRAIAYDNAWKFAEITVAINFRVIYKHYQQTFVVLHLDSVLVLRIVGCLQFGRVCQLRPAAVNVTDKYRSVEVYKYGVVVVVFLVGMFFKYKKHNRYADKFEDTYPDAK